MGVQSKGRDSEKQPGIPILIMGQFFINRGSYFTLLYAGKKIVFKMILSFY